MNAKPHNPDSPQDNLPNDVLVGELAFNVGSSPKTTGLFLTTYAARYEVIATTASARRALCSLDDESSVRARVCGSRQGERIDAIDIELAESHARDDAAANVVVFKTTGLPAKSRGSESANPVPAKVGPPTNHLGRSLIELYAATVHEPASVNPPRRLANMYFHPTVEGRELRAIPLNAHPQVLELAIYDVISTTVWFRQIDQRGRTQIDIVRGPFKVER